MNDFDHAYIEYSGAPFLRVIILQPAEPPRDDGNVAEGSFETEDIPWVKHVNNGVVEHRAVSERNHTVYHGS